MDLLKEGLANGVALTGLSRKITIGGTTEAYPVYRVPLELLYYNDQNDRIATWINQYRNENGGEPLSSLERATYNAMIERFIIQSNPQAIERTQNNIALIQQREPGVVLSDGRVIDGNRRFTCLRRLSQKDERFGTFETVILDESLENSRK